MHFIIFHGSFGNPNGNWFPYLKKRLEALGHRVTVPQFPVENWDEVTKHGSSMPLHHQSLEAWFRVFEPIIKTFHKEEKLCFVGHSLAPVFILRVVDRFTIQLDSAMFVSPFLDYLHSKEFWQFDYVNASFYKTDFDFEKLKRLIPVSYVLFGDNDPYVDRKYPLEFGEKMGSIVKEIKNGGHLNAESGYKEFPLLLDLCIARAKS